MLTGLSLKDGHSDILPLIYRCPGHFDRALLITLIPCLIEAGRVPLSIPFMVVAKAKRSLCAIKESGCSSSPRGEFLSISSRCELSFRLASCSLNFTRHSRLTTASHSVPCLLPGCYCSFLYQSSSGFAVPWIYLSPVFCIHT